MQGNKISLRPIVSSDLTYLNKWKNSEDVFKYLGGGYKPISIDQHETWMASLIDMTGSNRRFMIVNSSGIPVGMVGLYGINAIDRTCEVGLYIGDSHSQGKGYAKEAYGLVEDYSCRYLNIRKINLKVVLDNQAGVRLWESVGFDKVGQLHKERFVDGEYRDLLIMEKFIQSK